MSDFFELKTDKLMDKNELAMLCKVLRGMKDLTQADVAELIETQRGTPISKQSISVAENPDKAGVDSLRIEIIELLTGRKLSGPYWKFEPEPVEESDGD